LEIIWKLHQKNGKKLHCVKSAEVLAQGDTKLQNLDENTPIDTYSDYLTKQQLLKCQSNAIIENLLGIAEQLSNT